MRLTILLALSLTVVMVTSQPLSSSSQLPRAELEELYRHWPGVEDERLADAELDNAYELYKYKTRKPKILHVTPNDIITDNPLKFN